MLLRKLAQPTSSSRRWRFEREQPNLTSYGGSIAVGTPAVCRGKGDVQQQRNVYGGRTAVGTLAV